MKKKLGLIAAALAISLVGAINAQAADKEPVPESWRYGRIVNQAAKFYDLEPFLIQAIVKNESNFDPEATSQKGAKGLMQLMPGTAKEVNVQRITHPNENIWGGTEYFKKLLVMFKGDVILALAAYNAGPQRIIDAGYRVPPYPATKKYVRSVLRDYWGYKNLAQRLALAD